MAHRQTIDDVLSLAQSQNLQQVRFLYVDNAGTIRGKSSYVEGLRSRLLGGIGLTPAMQAMNMLDQLQDVPDMGPVGEVRLVPDLDSFRVVPYASRIGAVMCDMIGLDREPWQACPRSFLKKQVDAAADMGYDMVAVYEDEFTLAVPESPLAYRPLDPTLCFSSQGMDAAAPIIADLFDALVAQGITPEQYYPELGHGQHEVSIRPATILEAADNQVRVRETVRGVARQHGLVASFAPKPYGDQAGNGAHIHFSLWDLDRTHNLFWDANDRYHLSSLGYWFAAGVIRHLPALVALTTPTVNSFRRLNPRTWSSAYTAFGPDNREAAVRIASVFWGNEEGSINCELKASDSSANPYLAMGALLAAGLDGVRQRMPAPATVTVDPDTLTSEQRQAQGIVRLPSTLGEALAALEQDSVLCEALGPTLVRSYLAVKHSEVEAFSQQPAEFELQQHFSKF